MARSDRISPLSRRRVVAGLAATALAPLVGCQVSPGTGRSEFNLLSADDEREMGAKAHPQILEEFGGAYADPKIAAYVAGIGQRLVLNTETPAAEFRFSVLDSDIVNAMALPGGHVYITRGLLALVDNEAELAGVLGHEIGHVTARHTAQRYSRAMAANLGLTVLGAVVRTPGVGDIASMGANYWLQGYSQDQEMEADTLGVRYMSRAGYHADAMASMLGKLRDQARLEAVKAGRPADSVDDVDMLATHPRTIDRVRQAIANALGVPPTGVLGADLFLDAVDGLVYGDEPSQGVVRGRSFIHPVEGFRFDVPPGFRLLNSPKRVVARDQAGAAIVFDEARWRGGGDMGGGDMAVYLARGWGANVAWRQVERIDINGLPAVTAATEGRSSKGALDVRAVAIRGEGDTVWRMMFLTPPRRTAELGVELRRTTYSFRRLSAEERAAVRPWRIDVVTATAGDTVDSLARRMALQEWAVETFRLLNGLQPGEAVGSGRRVKLVV